MTGPQMPPETIDVGLRKRFESAWLAGRPEPIERFLPPEGDAKYLPTLEELVQIDLQLSWKGWLRAGQGGSAAPQEETAARPAGVETYLERFPRLNQPEIVLRLLKQECSARRQCGEDASIAEYRRRFPDLVIPEEQFAPGLPMLSQSDVKAPLAETLPTGPPGGSTLTTVAPGQFGNYESLEEIGRGGMGVVYRARQRTADRIVALKVIRRDRLETLPRETHTSALDRFRHEAQAAAKLEHDNIVTVYEVGEVDEQPFFSMRYVEGRSLSQILREGPIENRRAASYLEPVARAVHEAHGKGILHRDLKPQNILVDSKTDRALVADFGLAKLSEGQEELTRAGEVMGTPSYMSPEQAKDSAHVTAETDVYALGATLYHVLTGRPPFQAATPVETLRQVIDEEPAPPRQLNPSIHRDLETICLKCLQKEPSRRYDSAEALADDLRRYLGGEPILARPIGTVGRIGRWCRRKPALAAAIGLAASCLVVALVVAAVGYFQTSAALEESQASLDHARDTVRNFYTLVADHRLLDVPGMQPLRKELLAEARNYYQQLLDEHADDPTIRQDLAEAHYHVGNITQKIDSAEQALKSYQRARRMLEQLVSEDPTAEEHLRILGNTLNAMGTALHGLRKLDDARKVHLEAIQVRSRLAQAAPGNGEFQRRLANSHMNIGVIERERGNPEKARTHLHKAQAIRKRLLDRGYAVAEVRRDLGMGYYNLAILALVVPDLRAAESNFKQAIDQFDELVHSDAKGLLENQHRLAICYRLLANLKAAEKTATADRDAALSLYEQAFRLYQEALELIETLARENSARPDYQAELAGVHMEVGLLHREQGEPAAALTSLREARNILQPLVKAHSKVARYQRDFAVTLREIGRVQLDSREHPSARKNLLAAQEHLRGLVERLPDNAELKSELDKTKALLNALAAAAPHDQ